MKISDVKAAKIGTTIVIRVVTDKNSTRAVVPR